jgi:putative sterol carrier protein
MLLMAMTCIAAGADNKTPQDVFGGMRQSFRPDKAAGAHIKYQWNLHEPQGGDWFIEVNDGKCRIETGRIDDPDVTFVATGQDWVAISNGKLSGKWAYFTGRLKIRGPQSLARKLDEIFP